MNSKTLRWFNIAGFGVMVLVNALASLIVFLDGRSIRKWVPLVMR